MKITKKILSMFLTVLILSSAVVCASAATTHTIDASSETTIAAIDYTSATSVYIKNNSEYASNDDITVAENEDGSKYVKIIKEKKVSNTTRQIVSTLTYTLNVQKSGYYNLKLNGMYESTAPTVYISVDGGDEVSDKPFSTTETTALAAQFALDAGQHTLSLKFKGGDAILKNIYLKNMQKDIGSGVTIVPIVEYISTTNKSGTRNYGSNGVRGCIPVYSTETANLGSSSGLHCKYKINVSEEGQYRVSAWSGSNLSNLYANTYIMADDGVTILAGGTGIPGKGITTTAPATTSAFNLSEGVQNLNLRFQAVNTDPVNLADGVVYLYYLEIERIDSTQESAQISATGKTAVEPENVFFTDNGITKTSDSAKISAGSTAYFYADIPADGQYTVSFDYKTDSKTYVNAITLTTDIYKDYLIPAKDEFLNYTLSVTDFKAGQNRISIAPDKDIEIEKIYFNKISDETVLDAINAAETEDALKAAITATEEALDIEFTDVADGIFYDRPVYNKLMKKEYSSLKKFVAEYNDAILDEYDNPWVTLYVDGVKKSALETGDIKFTVSTGYVPKGSTMIVALYENFANGATKLSAFAVCEEVSENTYDFILGQTEIKDESSYTVEFYYWDGFKKIKPIEVFNAVYDEIYVSTTGDDSSGDGSEEYPYATIEKALEKVDAINDYQWGDIIVNVEGGIYTITETMVIDEKYSGKNGFNVIIRGEENNQPIISGGINVTDWKVSSGNIWKAKLSGVDYVRNLYVNDYPAVLARSDRHYDTAESKRDEAKFTTTIYNIGSNEGTKVDVKDINMTSASTGLDANLVENTGYGFSMSLKELGTDFSQPVGMEFVWPYSFEHHITPVIDYKKTADNITFYMNNELLQKRENSTFKTGVAFYLQNAKELLNKPGEFYYDKAEGYIYYYPYSYEDMKTAETYIGNVEGMVEVKGSSLESKVSDITFENLSFRYGANNFISKYGYIGSQTDGILQPFAWSDGEIAYKAQFAIDNADNVNIKGCEFACLGSAAISMIHSVSDSYITGNIIRDISGTGIRIGHPIHNKPREGIEVCRNIDITNNVIRRIAGETFNNCGITVYYEKFINILHNDIENVPYSGMSIGWGWGGGAAYDHSDITVSYNKIQDVMNTLHDGGGIYTLGPIKNGIISDNYLNGHGSRSGGMIYNDQGSALMTVYNNVILNAVLSQAITMANDVTSSTKKLTYYNNYSDAGTRPKIADGKEIDFEEHIIVSGEGENLNNAAAKEIYRNAGLESEYKYLLSEEGVELPEAGREISSKLPDEPVSDVVKMYSTEYSKEDSSDDLELIPYADGAGISVTGTKKVTYKLDIPESGYYRIVLRAMGGGTVNYNGLEVGGEAQNVIMRVYGSKVTNNQLAIGNNNFYNYRICTAYFEKGKRNITFTVTKPENEIIIKELHYASVEIPVASQGVNVIKLKNYYNASGLSTNTYENKQTGYPSEGAKYHVTGAVTNGAGKTTTLTYKLNVEQAGIYKVTAAAWVGAYSPVTYDILIGDEVKSTGTTMSYSLMKKSEDTELTDLELPAGEVELKFRASSSGANYSIMYYFTLEKKN